LQAINKIASDDRITVRPLGIFAQRERIGQAILGHLKASRHTRLNGSVRVFGHETYKQVTGDRCAFNVFNQSRVDGREIIQN
jgi:hypothetical protein